MAGILSMAKNKPNQERYIPVQKGPVRCEETNSLAFYNEEPTRRDLEMNQMRRSGMSLTKHEPKR